MMLDMLRRLAPTLVVTSTLFSVLTGTAHPAVAKMSDPTPSPRAAQYSYVPPVAVAVATKMLATKTRFVRCSGVATNEAPLDPADFGGRTSSGTCIATTPAGNTIGNVRWSAREYFDTATKTAVNGALVMLGPPNSKTLKVTWSASNKRVTTLRYVR